jgi:hypothetical protein
MEMVRYGKALASVTSAAGVRGCLLRSIDGSFFFRVYSYDGEFTDYEIRHDDLEVTISSDELASFYSIGEDRLLDHSPEVLGLERVPDEPEPDRS